MSRITGLKGSVAASGSEEPSGAATRAASRTASGAASGLSGSKSAGASRRGLGMVCRVRAWLKQLLSSLLDLCGEDCASCGSCVAVKDAALDCYASDLLNTEAPKRV